MNKAELIATANEATAKAYTPYSHFNVGAALVTSDGRVFDGCNIENASYGLANCAERTAIFKAVSEGAADFKAIAITADTDGPVSPCGACRQVMAEFFTEETIIYLTNTKGDTVETTIQQLLPGSFSANDMKR